MPNYGYQHKQMRKQWTSAVNAGQVQCARCGVLIEAGTPWDMGHVDGSDAYSGPEHRACNRATLTHAKASTSTAYDWFVSVVR